MATLSKLACLALLVPQALSALGITLCTSAVPECSYDVSATGLDVSGNPPTEDTSVTWDLLFDYTGPLTFTGIGPLISWSVAGTPASGWVYDSTTSGITSYGSDAAVQVTFDDHNLDGFGITSVTYEFFGNSLFWQTLGTQPFGATNDSSAASGAFFIFNGVVHPGGPMGFGPTVQADPVCTACTLTTSANVIPEPGSLILVGAAGLFGLLLRRRRAN